jgi:hypothetical protein
VAAVRRIRGERLEEVAEVARILRLPPKTVERYIVRGCRGVFLDGLHRPGVGWMTSLPAARRFLDALPDLLGGRPMPTQLAALSAAEFTEGGGI